jgi:hypothetical protein
MFHGRPPSREDNFPHIVSPRTRPVFPLSTCSYNEPIHSALFVYNASMPFRAQGSPNAVKRGRTPPPEETFEEASFLKALGEKQKPVSVKLMDGQTVRGWIEYYDKYMVR